ncbi:MAG: HPr(Ser) kinase/phosphatase [bacterium]|nr:HPr(Ser) kinase/phosphatase [bacterium]
MAVKVRDLYEDNRAKLELTLATDDGTLDREINRPDIERPGLALAGYFDVFPTERVLLLGHTESSYLATLSSEARRAVFDRLTHDCGVPCFVVTRGYEPPGELIESSATGGIPVLTSPEHTQQVVTVLGYYLQEALAPVQKIHGVLVDINGVGVLILGKAGIGKSECALDLVARGHRLVADDVVEVKARFNSVLIGSSPEKIREYMEIRGIGIINVRHLFGVNAVRDQKRIELVVQIRQWDGGYNYDRIGMDTVYREIIGIRIPQIVIPAIPGKNLGTIVELAAASHLLRRRGYNPARELDTQLLEEMNASAREARRLYVNLTDDLQDTE